MMRIFLPVLCLLLLAVGGCASTKPRFETSGVNTAITPQLATRDAVAQAPEVLWGGVIVNSSNLADVTQLEILAYPLSDNQRPNTDRPAIGRFLALSPGYLETADYAQGRLITVRGQLRETAAGRIGEADYTYPVVDIIDSQLWKRNEYAQPSARPRVNFGIGVMIGR